ncbi:hypothetical protein GCM10027294_36300 [Marinactinospora endophytica]
MKSTPAEMSIGELAERFGLAPHVLRHWESVGLLRPDRRSNGRRCYGPDHVARVVLIQRGKEAGLRLEQIRALFDASGGPDRRALLAGHLEGIDARIARLRVARHIVEHTMSCPAPDFLTCPRLRELLDGLVASGAPTSCASSLPAGADTVVGTCGAAGPSAPL